MPVINGFNFVEQDFDPSPGMLLCQGTDLRDEMVILIGHPSMRVDLSRIFPVDYDGNDIPGFSLWGQAIELNRWCVVKNSRRVINFGNADLNATWFDAEYSDGLVLPRYSFDFTPWLVWG